MFNAYFQDELQFLRDVGPEFAKANPDLARFLADRGSDPDVERLLEGVAFLCGRIRQKLDDELPEFTAGLMSLLWPHYIRPIPSMSILEFIPNHEAMQAPMNVQRGAEVLSIPVDGTRCRYRVCWPVTLRPVALTAAQLQTALAEPMRLRLRLEATGKSPLPKLDLGRLQLFLHGEPRTAFMMYLLLCAHVETVLVRGLGSKKQDEYLPPESIRPMGLDRSEAVLPYPSHSFIGYRLLQEYFAFKEKFLFIEISGLDRAAARLEEERGVEIDIVFNRRLETPPMISRDNVRLHCAPIINLFNHPADPIRVAQDRAQYLIQPSKTGVADRRHLETYSVDRVLGLVRAQGLETHEYLPFYSFEHIPNLDRTVADYYQTHITPDVVSQQVGRGTDTYISFVNSHEERALPPEETISIDLTCTNRHLPAALRALDVATPTDTSPQSATFRNLVKPTATVAPPLGRGLHWRLISHMSLNYSSLADAKHLRELLHVYDFEAEHDAQLAAAHRWMMDGILKVKADYSERMVRGVPLRGSRVDLTLQEDHFAGEGDAYLFATILDRFFGLYVTLNSYSQLDVRMQRSGRRYAFEPRWGEQLTPSDVRS